MAQIIAQVANLTRTISGQLVRNTRQFHALTTTAASTSLQPKQFPRLFEILKANYYDTFRPKEHKRRKKHGYYVKMKTRKGRLQIMRRILKGRFVLAH
ncbi:UNVERIFIED_CONTAM: hypothetical protein PYX00_001615 [Menopon gallinae]|uniref:39S ribosomal protein L34, mitochondrial n=1 Tax=Menopon gallinae TaxID=328185 RepID=A0AAW2IDG2_9NEOP